MKHALTNAPVLALPDWSKQFEVVCDASQIGLGAVLMQDGRPLAFASRKLNSAERNYNTTEREMLAVVWAVGMWHPYLEYAQQNRDFTVVTDHNPNTFFKSQPILSRRQARWSEYLEQYRFKWQYRPGKNNVADPLSRHPDFTLACIMACEPQPVTVLPMLMEGNTRQARRRKAIKAKRQGEGGDANGSTIDVDTPLVDAIRLAYRHDNWFTQEHIEQFGLVKHEKLWWREATGQLVVPCDRAIRRRIMAQHHEPKFVGHPGQRKTLELIERLFWWPRMRADIDEFVATCDVCQRNKPSLQKPAGLLKPLPVPPARFHTWTMDYVVGLPETEDGNTEIMVMVEKLTKLSYLVPAPTGITAEQSALFFMKYVIAQHGMPMKVIHDRGKQFDSKFWQTVMSELGVDDASSSAHHPQTDGQTERVNRVMEDMLRNYVSSRQRDWDRLLPMVQFAINNAYHESIKTTPFELVYGCSPRTPMHLAVPRPYKEVVEYLDGDEVLRRQHRSGNNTRRGRAPAAERFTSQMQEAVVKARACLSAARDRQKLYADKNRRKVEYKVGDRVLLDTRNIKLKAVGTRKLLPKFIGPYTITKRINEVAFKLKLPHSLHLIHDVFHVSMFKLYKEDDERMPRPPQPVEIEGEFEFEVEAILGHRVSRRRGRPPRSQAAAGPALVRSFLIKWKDQGHEENSWEPESNLTNCPELLNEYLRLHGSEIAAEEARLRNATGVVTQAPAAKQPGRKRKAQQQAPSDRPQRERRRTVQFNE